MTDSACSLYLRQGSRESRPTKSLVSLYLAKLSFLVECVFTAGSVVSSERVPEALSPGIQGGRREEVPLHPAPLQRLQGPVGLADPAGHLLRGGHRAVRRVLRRPPRDGPRPRGAQLRPGGVARGGRERHRRGDALHTG